MSASLKFLGPLMFIAFLAGSCSQNNVTEDAGLKKFFDQTGVTGSFGLFDNGHGHFTIYNLPRFRDSAFLPSGSFDIVQSLIAFQTGVIKNDSTLITDSLTIRKAFRISNDQAFQSLAIKLGKDTLKKWIDTLAYGNKAFASPIDSFWLNDQLQLTADEQLGLLKKLYFEQLPFFPRSQKLAAALFNPEANSNYALKYKTAAGTGKNGHLIGWVLGWIEENKNAYFFVLNWDTPSPEKAPTDKGLAMLHSILADQGFFQGKK